MFNNDIISLKFKKQFSHRPDIYLLIIQFVKHKNNNQPISKV